jgi:hypothetical protein
MMPELTLEPTLPVTVESAWRPELRNPYVELPSVKATATLAGKHSVFLTHLSLFVCSAGIRQGYSAATTSKLRSSLLRLPMAYEDVKKAEKALENLATDYEQKMNSPGLDAMRRQNLATDFTSAISEAIAIRFLLRSPRQPQELVSDAHFRIGDGDQSASNIDVAWWRQSRCRADLYECKHSPRRLLDSWATRDYPGNQIGWKRSQLFLMLSVYAALTHVKWGVCLCCITLRQREAVEDSLAILGCPQELTVYCQEDLGAGFPPPI